MGIVIRRLYFGQRPSEAEIRTNGSILDRLHRKRPWPELARVVEGLALRRDRGELHGVERTEPVSLRWVIDSGHQLNQIAMCEDAYYRPNVVRGKTGDPTKLSDLVGEHNDGLGN